jgi:hypothetical protein
VTGAEHYEAAEVHLAAAEEEGPNPDSPLERYHLGMAQVHALLALAAATALAHDRMMPPPAGDQWRAVTVAVSDVD